MKKKIIKVRLDESIINDLKVLSEIHKEPVAFIIRTILNDYINYYNSKKS